MNKFRKILVIILLISILIGLFCTVNAEKITYDVNYLIPLANNVHTLSNNSKVAENIELKQTLDGNYTQLQDWINYANKNNDKVEIEKSEIDIIEENVRNAGRLLLPEGNQQQGTNTQNNSQSNTNNQQSSTDTQTTQNNNQAKDTKDDTQESSEFGDTYYIPTSIKRVEGGNVYIVHAHTKDPPKETQVLISPLNGDKRKYYVYRSKDTKLKRTMAFLAADLANNDNVQYKLGDPGLQENFRKVNYTPSAITQICKTDCSKFVATSIEGAYNKANNPKGPIDFDTDQMEGDLPKYGFELQYNGELKTIKDWGQSGKLEIGDILLALKRINGGNYGHTVIFLGPYYTSGKIAPSSSGAYGNGTSGGYTAEGEEIDDKQNIDEKNFRFSGLPGDVTYEGELTPIRNFFAKIGDFIDYLLGLIFLVIKIIIIGFVNIAYNIFLSIVSLMKK